MTRVKETAYVKRGQKTGGRPSAAKKRKSALAMADAAGDRAVKALAARRRGKADAEERDELGEQEEEAEQEEEEEEEEDGEESGDIEEQESQEAESHGEPQKKRRPRSKVLIVSLPWHPSIFPDVFSGIVQELHTCIYSFVLVVPGFKKPANEVRTRDILHTFRLLHRCTARAQRGNTGYLSTALFVFITVLLCSCPGRVPGS